MKLNVMNNVKEKFFKALESIGNFINQVPEKEVKTLRASTGPLKEKAERPSAKSNKQKVPKGDYGHKGSSYHGKGNVTTDATTFNHPRKSVPKGMGRK